MPDEYFSGRQSKREDVGHSLTYKDSDDISRQAQPDLHDRIGKDPTVMSSEKTEGIILRVTDFSETSRIVELFSREFGRMSGLAKGGRRLKGPFESALDLLATCQLVFLRKSTTQLHLLTAAQLVERFRPAERELTCLYGGYYVAELLHGLTEEDDPHPVLYDEARQTLQLLAQSSQQRRAILRFELVLLREIGQLPDFEACAECGALLEGDLSFGFWISQGGLICPDCQQEDYTQVLVQAGTAAALRLLASEHQGWRHLELTPRQIQDLRRLATMCISHALGHRPKMLTFLT